MSPRKEFLIEFKTYVFFLLKYVKLARFFFITFIMVMVENIRAYINPCKLQLLSTDLTEEITQHKEQFYKNK